MTVQQMLYADKKVEEYRKKGYLHMDYCNMDGGGLFPPDFVPNPKRLDAPCDVCKNFYCEYRI